MVINKVISYATMRRVIAVVMALLFLLPFVAAAESYHVRCLTRVPGVCIIGTMEVPL